MTRAILMLACGIAAIGLAGCGQQPASSGPQLPAVTVSKPLQQRITEWDEYTGRFVAVATVDVRARVSGFIDSLHFRDGQVIKQGDLLFTVDQRPYKLAVDQAKADLDRTRAKLEIANLDLERATPLVRNQTLTEREFETRRSTQRDAMAAMESAEATLKVAQLNLEWTEVRAPIAGRISDRRVDAGNLITGGQSGATLLTSIVTIDPIHFIFDGAEADFIRYLRLARAGQRQSSRDAANPVAVRLADETEFKHEGKMDFVDNVLNARTGTIRGRAIFENKDGFLTPGFFGRMRLFGGDHDALLIPDSAIASDQSNKIVMTVADDGTVGVKRVEIGPIVRGLRVIRSGLDANDRVVIEGLPRARPGQKVKPEEGKIEGAVAQAAPPIPGTRAAPAAQ
jgi:RND family efflux transporter MFP subunit